MLKCRLNELVKKKDINFAQLAKEIGYRPNTIYRLAEDKMKYVENELAVALCHFFECGISDLFYLPDEKVRIFSYKKGWRNRDDA